MKKLLFIILLLSCKSYKQVIVNTHSYDFYKLLELGYFDYSNDSMIKFSKSVMESNPYYKIDLPYFYNEETNEVATHRIQHIDGEFVWDKGGMKYYLTNQLQSYCEVSGLILNIENIKEELSKNNIANYSITVNNKTYKILDNHKVRSSEVWRIVPLNIAIMLNDQLNIQEMNDKVFISNVDNDCTLSFLTYEQQKFLIQILKNEENYPLKPKDWKEIYCKLENDR